MASLTDTLTTPGGLIVPGSRYDLTLTHDGELPHTHTVPNAAVATFWDQDGTVRYEAQATDLVIGFLAPHVTGATLKL